MTYCAPCLADLALVREAATSVSGTAACVAHAVLLTHPGDTPQRRLERLSDLRAMAEGKLPTASAEDVPAIELLVQEYALAGAMDMTVPLKDLAGERAPRPAKRPRNRGRDRDRERGPRPGSADVSEAQGAQAPSASDSSGESAPHQPAAVATSPDLSEPDSAPAPSAPEAAPAPAAPAAPVAPEAPEAPAAPAAPAAPERTESAPEQSAPVAE